MSDATAKTPRAAAPIAPYMALAGIWLLTITIVPPRGDFPLNDDWMYAKVVQHLVETGEYQATPYADPTFILQAYWGAAFVKIFGFSFETLRVSTLVLGLVAVWAAHWAAREAGLTTRWAFLVALTLLVNPLFLNLSYTFMTDVPFLALSVLAGAAYLRALRTNLTRWIAVATSIAMIAFFVRQFALVVVIAAVEFFIPTFPVKNPWPALRQWLGFLIPLLAWVLVESLLPSHGLEMAKGWDWTRLGETWGERITDILSHAGFTFCYLALFAAPFAFAGIAAYFRNRSTDNFSHATDSGTTPKPENCHSEQREESPAKTAKAPLRIVMPVLALPLLITYLITSRWPHRLPNLGNLLYDFGIGPLLMPGMLDDNGITAPVHLGAIIWWSITILVIPGAAVLVALHLHAGVHWLTSSERRSASTRADLFLALWSIGMVLVLIMPPVLARFDRYFVMAQIPATILAARWLARTAPQPARASYAAAAVLWVIGIVCQQDYLAWNAARWNALAALQRDHAAPLEQINGGYEFNGWFHSDVYAEESRRTGQKIFGPQGWWIRGDEYRVSLRPNDHFEVIGTEPYFSWLGWERREVLLLKRTEPDTNSALFD